MCRMIFSVSQLTSHNAPRPGVLANMTVDHVMAARMVPNGEYVILVRAEM